MPNFTAFLTKLGNGRKYKFSRLTKKNSSINAWFKVNIIGGIKRKIKSRFCKALGLG